MDGDGSGTVFACDVSASKPAFNIICLFIIDSRQKIIYFDNLHEFVNLFMRIDWGLFDRIVTIEYLFCIMLITGNIKSEETS